MKKSGCLLLVSSIILSLFLTVCGTEVLADDTVETGGSMKLDAASEDTGSSGDRNKEEFADDWDIAYVNADDAQILHEHAELISFLKEKDYAAAEEYIHHLLTEQEKEAAGDIEDYITTVDITADNIEEYFECVKIPIYNAFGELQSDTAGYGLRSRMYDEGYILYELEDGIKAEYATGGTVHDSDLNDLLFFGNAITGAGDADSLEYSLTGRVIGGQIRFLDRDYVESYDIPEPPTPDEQFVQAQIKLKNGETITRAVNPEYPF